ncbi:MAG: lytic transglycosylase [Paracoccaceae bacterium]
MRSLLIVLSFLIVALTQDALADESSARPQGRPASPPPAQWQEVPDARLWSRAADAALRGHGASLINMVPGDVTGWCPHYADAPPAARRAFWIGFLSTLSHYESTWRPDAVGGGGRWFGLLQIAPATARGYGCAARSGTALKDGPANLSCAIRIMARTVARDGVIHGRDSKWRGVSADWGPMRSARKRAAMAEWLRGQPYCQMPQSLRPVRRRRSEPEGG